MSLRGEIARRLCRLQWETMDDEPGRKVEDAEISAAQGPGTTWGDIADECIRQMEWARRKTTTPGWTMVIGDMPRKVVINQMDELTIAPEDWKP